MTTSPFAPGAPSRVVLVDRSDNEVGVEEKLQAHVLGRLHRAVSVFVFNSADELLLQRRAATKYHCGGLWSNTCCGHPEPGETTVSAATRRLREEMGLTCALRHAGSFVYRVPVGGGLVEHELDHVFHGRSDSVPALNADEVDELRWVRLDVLDRDLRENSACYTPWLSLALDQLRRAGEAPPRARSV